MDTGGAGIRYVRTVERDLDKSSNFRMPIEDVFTITGRTVVTGRVEGHPHRDEWTGVEGDPQTTCTGGDVPEAL